MAGTLLTVVLIAFLTFQVGDYAGQESSGGAATNLATPVAAGACGEGKEADPTYSVDLVATPDPPRPEGTNLLFTVRRAGTAVTGAKVCVSTDMPEMAHPGLTTVTKEGSGGRYETRIQFGMGGSWRTSVIIAEPDKPVVWVPMTIQVAEIQPA
ncbi:MAG: FixH family protein [Acidimicrobiales bacterium]